MSIDRLSFSNSFSWKPGNHLKTYIHGSTVVIEKDSWENVYWDIKPEVTQRQNVFLLICSLFSWNESDSLSSGRKRNSYEVSKHFLTLQEKWEDCLNLRRCHSRGKREWMWVDVFPVMRGVCYTRRGRNEESDFFAGNLVLLSHPRSLSHHHLLRAKKREIVLVRRGKSPLDALLLLGSWEKGKKLWHLSLFVLYSILFYSILFCCLLFLERITDAVTRRTESKEDEKKKSIRRRKCRQKRRQDKRKKTKERSWCLTHFTLCLPFIRSIFR